MTAGSISFDGRRVDGLDPEDIARLGIAQVMEGRRVLEHLTVEQNAVAALELASHGYVMESGRVVLEGPAAQLRENEDVKEFYLGFGSLAERKSYRDVKHYKRRKRWLG